MLLFTYATIAVPTFITHSIGTWVFLLSGALSLLIMVPFFLILRVILLRGKKERTVLIEARIIVAAIFIGFNCLYFLHVIPPVPLSLKDIGVYHSLTRLDTAAGSTESIYSASYEPAPWYVFWRDTSGTFTIASATADASCFSSIFAPTDLSTSIYHTWEHYDDASGKWLVVSRISFPINGGPQRRLPRLYGRPCHAGEVAL